MEFTTNDYSIQHNIDSGTVFLKGSLRLSGMNEYQPIMDLLLDAVEQSATFTLNLRELEFLNSSGISMLSMFIVKVRQKETIQMVLQGSDQVLWQTKSLKNLQRLMPTLKLEFA